ncbi:MAG: hypothetical protein FWH20_02490 [Oscillospiraceae bacterium]|nr:hypothetical protein [Oscillospiraceae bacterium]
MKRFVQIVAIVAALSLFAIGASALTATGPTTANVGDSITVTVSTADAGDINGVLVVTTSGAVFTRATGQNGVSAVGNVDTGRVALAGVDVEAGAIVTLNFEVLGDFSIQVAGAEDFADISTMTVSGTATELPSEPGTPVGPTTPGNENPKAGVALAIVPALVAGAAVAVARKRK